jgi:hypothetical protein
MSRDKSPLTLQINSLEALERLIGGDTQMEFDIRQSVVEAFCKKHLKSVTQEQSLKLVERSMIEQIKSEIFVGNNYNTLQLPFKDQVKRYTDSIVDFQIKSLVDEKIKLKSQELDKLIQERIDYQVREFQNFNTDEMIDKIVDKRIKEKLGLK